MMPSLLLDPMDNAARWTTTEPDGATPSSEITLTDEKTYVRFGSDRTSGRLAASAAASGHLLRRQLPDVDLTSFSEIRIWVLASRAATGTAAQPFFVEVRLGSAALPIGAAGNTWSRLLPVAHAAQWELVRFSLDDLAQQVRVAANTIELRCLAAAALPFTCYFDDVLAVREAMVGDIDAALLALLDGQAALEGAAVPATILHPENPQAQLVPSIRLNQYDIQLAGERTLYSRSSSDYTSNGFRLAPSSIAYDVYYAIDVYASTRSEKTTLLEFVLGTLAPRRELVVNGLQLPVQWVTIEPLDDTGKFRSERELLYFKVSTRQEVGATERAVLPYAEVGVHVNGRL